MLLICNIVVVIYDFFNLILEVSVFDMFAESSLKSFLREAIYKRPDATGNCNCDFC